MQRKLKARAFMLILCLLLTTLIVSMGLAFLGKRAAEYKGASQVAAEAQALACAEAGLEDARLKIWKDNDFPPPGSVDQTFFSYSEALNDLSGNPVGSYTVTVDTTYVQAPYAILRVISLGVAGSAQQPLARRTLKAEIDLSPVARTSASPSPNPRYFNYLNLQDSGAY